jgi:hypothetical protein
MRGPTVTRCGQLPRPDFDTHGLPEVVILNLQVPSRHTSTRARQTAAAPYRRAVGIKTVIFAISRYISIFLCAVGASS